MNDEALDLSRDREARKQAKIHLENTRSVIRLRLRTLGVSKTQADKFMKSALLHDADQQTLDEILYRLNHWKGVKLRIFVANVIQPDLSTAKRWQRNLRWWRESLFAKK